MTQFASRTASNADPAPYVVYRNHRRTDERVAEHYTPRRVWFNGELVEQSLVHDPRPEFDRPQINPTNPILDEFRRGDSYPGKAADYLTYLDGDVYDWSYYAPDVFAHARRVLTRLSKLGDEETVR